MRLPALAVVLAAALLVDTVNIFRSQPQKARGILYPVENEIKAYAFPLNCVCHVTISGSQKAAAKLIQLTVTKITRKEGVESKLSELRVTSFSERQFPDSRTEILTCSNHLYIWYPCNQSSEKKDCKRSTLEKPHSKGSPKGHKNSLQNSPKLIHFLLIVSTVRITMFGKGKYAAVRRSGIHSFLTAVGGDSFVGWDVHFCLLALQDFKCYLTLVAIELYVITFIQCVINIASRPSFSK